MRWLILLLLLVLGLGGGDDGLLPLDLLAFSCLLAITLHDGSAAIQRRVKSSLLFGSVEILVKWRGAAITWIVSCDSWDLSSSYDAALSVARSH